jgi:DNA-directed RNA polymerase sigma subunit (sigma70/sigma32)
MALPILQIAKLLGQLTVIGPVVTDGVDKMRKLVETIRQGNGTTAKELEAMKQAIELQSAVNKKVDDQLRLVESVLKNMQKSLRVLTVTNAALAIVVAAALAIAILK